MTNISKSERLRRKKRKAEKIIFAIGITAVIFVVATYAWFIGTTQISVNDFTLSVKSGDGLEISLDGITFDSSVTISKDILTALAATEGGTYLPTKGNKNYWTTEGLEPVSTVGQMDVTNSVLKIYNKTSISSLTGGYKLRSNLIDNTAGETGGIVVFDLFLKNKSGIGYQREFDHAIDEGVYLIGDSSVSLTAQGADGESLVGGDGIENSVRLAFMQIGRIDMNEDDKDKVQGISCTADDEDDDEVVTSLCARTTSEFTTGQGMTWNIWEPNDLSHISNAKTHFEAICKARTAENTYDGACSGVTANHWNGTEYIKTYPVQANVTAADNVNIYDGLNGYNGTIGTSKFLMDFDYFTDTDKNEADKKELFFISPNSITKLRVYVYLEGQDIDNYDLGVYGKQIKINFGFTKDKFGISGSDEDDPDEPEEPAVGS